MEVPTIFQRHRAGWIRTIRRRLFEDTHLMLAVAIVTAAVIIELFAGDPAVVALIPSGLAYIGLQVVLGRTSSPLGRPIPRLLAAVGYVAALGLFVGEVAARPTVSLYLPIVAMAAVYGRREAMIVGGAALAAYAAPIVVMDVPDLAAPPARGLLHRGDGPARARAPGGPSAPSKRPSPVPVSPRARERRRARQMAGVEAVGGLVASGGSTDALDGLMALMVERFGYPLVSIYLLEDDGTLRLGAQRGYDPEHVIESFDGSSGVIGRVMRTRESALVRDVATDPDYEMASDAVRSEITVPLIAGGDLLGVLNVEHPDVGGLDESDRSTLVLVGERIAGAIALGRERADDRGAGGAVPVARRAVPDDQRLDRAAQALPGHRRRRRARSCAATSSS